jgi:hypothetical protein
MDTSAALPRQVLDFTLIAVSFLAFDQGGI